MVFCPEPQREALEALPAPASPAPSAVHPRKGHFPGAALPLPRASFQTSPSLPVLPVLSCPSHRKALVFPEP